MMVSNFYSCRNAQQALDGSNQPEKALVKTNPIPNITSAPFQATISALAPALYTQKGLERITKLCIDSFL